MNIRLKLNKIKYKNHSNYLKIIIFKNYHGTKRGKIYFIFLILIKIKLIFLNHQVRRIKFLEILSLVKEYNFLFLFKNFILFLILGEFYFKFCQPKLCILYLIICYLIIILFYLIY